MALATTMPTQKTFGEIVKTLDLGRFFDGSEHSTSLFSVFFCPSDKIFTTKTDEAKCRIIAVEMAELGWHSNGYPPSHGRHRQCSQLGGIVWRAGQMDMAMEFGR